jgi:hypothetical protein
MGNSCLPAPNGPRPAQRASHSPSQGRRPWRSGDPHTILSGPTGRPFHKPRGGNGRPVGPINRCRRALHRPLLPSGPHPGVEYRSVPRCVADRSTSQSARSAGCVRFVLARPQRAASGPKGQPFPQPGSKALEVGDPHNIPSGPTGRPFHESRGGNGWPVGPKTVVLGTFPSPMGWAGGMTGPLGLSIVVARHSTGRCCRPVHIPFGRTAR